MQFHSLSVYEYYDRQPGEDRPVLPRRDGTARPMHAAGPPRTPEFGSSLFDPFDASRGTYPVAPDSGMISIPLTHMNVVLSMSATAMLQPRRGGLTMHANAAADPEPAAVPRGTMAQFAEAGQIAIDGLNILHAPRDLGLAELVPERHSSDPVVERLSRALEAAESSHDGFGNLYADAVRLAIVTRLLTLRSDPEPDLDEPTARATAALPRWRWKRVVEYVDSHLDEKIALADMAAVAGLSRMYFAAQFRAATGIRPHVFLLRRRIDRAKQMLIETEMTLVDVALSVGFQNQAHFTTVFRRFVGETPYRWRCGNRTDVADRPSDSDPACWRYPSRGSDTRPIQLASPGELSPRSAAAAT
ncbi:AraC family transcriptional regulator [Mesorhizobium sp. Root695]|uniref:AraC family transcriptional regulator n=1 Tax=Mesorhizobium sp. Root695 TaxID=1736589 RepID=UPI000B2893E4|nr:AraC family transcriptional regulator [Mesorhizobium sp. Root695]